MDAGPSARIFSQKVLDSNLTKSDIMGIHVRLLECGSTKLFLGVFVSVF